MKILTKFSRPYDVRLPQTSSTALQTVYLLEGMRPKQWTKNFLVGAALLFSGHIVDLDYVFKTLAAFFAFSFTASALYLINDIVDISKDRAHPIKKKRPLASGRLNPTVTKAGIGILLMITITVCFFLNLNFVAVIIAYFVLTLLYTFILKNIVIVDVVTIAIGFVLRAVAGAIVIEVEISRWLLLCTTFLALFLVLCKRRHELILLGENGSTHRRTLGEYSTAFLDQMVGIVTASTVMSYALYTTSAETVAKFGTNNLIFTLPFVLYGIFQYLYLVHQRNLGGSPEMALLKDKGTIINLILYILTLIFIIYF